jgi:hypothetical protein
MLCSRIRQVVFGLTSLVITAALMQWNGYSAANAKDGGLVGVEGVLTSVNPTAGTVTIRTRRMQDVIIATNTATKIERNDRRATLAMFQLGDRVEAKLASAMSNVAVKVEAEGP